MTVSSIFEGRCFEQLIEACALLRSRGSTDIHVRVVGRGNPHYVAALRAQVRARNVEDTITFEDAVDESEVAETYLDGHVALALYDTSFPHNDVLPNKVLEAVAAGRPVIATDSSQVRAFIEPTCTGWLTGATPAEIADAIESVGQDLRLGATDLNEMAARCRNLGDRGLTWEREFGIVLTAVRAASTQARVASRVGDRP